jgi:hypothetical protein
VNNRYDMGGIGSRWICNEMSDGRDGGKVYGESVMKRDTREDT